MVDDLIRDVRYGVRRLLRAPVFTFIAVLTLGLGIGVNAAIFTLVNKALLKPLPVQDPSRLIALSNISKEGNMFPSFSYLNYKDFRDRNASVAELFAYSPSPVSLSHNGVNERVWGYLVSGNYFDVLGLRPAAGRLIAAADDVRPGAHPVTVISYEAWRRRFGATRDVIGRDVIVNGTAFTIIGVAPADFVGVEVAFTAEMWFPIMMESQVSPRSRWLESRRFENLYVAGRLRPGTTNAAASAALSATAAELEREFPDDNKGKSIELSGVGLFASMGRLPVMGVSGVLMAVVGLVLLLVCTNLVNLCLARGADRQREIVMQQALGAPRWRIVRQLVTESLLLSLAGGVAGLILTYWLMGLVSRFRLPIDIPLSFAFQVDWRVLVFTLLVSLGAGVAFGLMPAWQSTAPQKISSAPRRARLRSVLVAAQVSLSFVLMVCAGLMLRSLQQAENADLGMNPRNAVEVGFDVDLQGYSRERGTQFVRELLTRVRALPGVEAAGVGSAVPPDPHIPGAAIRIEGTAVRERGNASRSIFVTSSPGFRAALGVPLLKGRDFAESDSETSVAVCLVNETFAARFLNGQDPLGKRIALGEAGEAWIQIVGVVGDGKYRSVGEDPSPFMMVPLRQRYSGLLKIVTRTLPGTSSPLEAIRRQIQGLDPNMPVFDAQTLTEHMRLPMFFARVAAAMFGAFGMLAAVLAALGIFGVVSFTVSRRTHEIGIRMALGAGRKDVMKLILRQGLIPVFVGLGVGFVGALVIGPLIEIDAVLYGTSATDPLTFGVIAALLGTVAFVACYLPARGALQVDPLVALRQEG